jgi:hypothetical protein
MNAWMNVPDELTKWGQVVLPSTDISVCLQQICMGRTVSKCWKVKESDCINASVCLHLGYFWSHSKELWISGSVGHNCMHIQGMKSKGRKQFGGSWKNLNTGLPHNPANPLLGIYPELNTGITQIPHTYVQSSTAALFTTAQRGYSHTTDYLAIKGKTYWCMLQCEWTSETLC